VRTYFVEHEGVDPTRVKVIENGVEWEALAALDHHEGRRKLEAAGVPPGFLIGCAATFDVRKGHTYLLDAMSIIRPRHPEVQLVLLGAGAGERAVRAQAERLGIADHVHFLGPREDAHQLVAGVDLYVQPSIEEGFGLAVIEAMAMRHPVVVSAVGGMVETVEHDRSGLHVPPAHPGALADAILALLDDPERAKKLGRAATERVRQRYSLERVLAAYDEVYRLRKR
jgi:glycosyltransferase involved in cell wall biosynthesis